MPDAPPEPAPPVPPRAGLRIATYNVEWFSNLFDMRGRLLDDTGWSARYNVTRADQLAALGTVFRAMDADAVMIIEAPDESRRRHSVKMLEAFAAHQGLRTRRALLGFPNETTQEIALLYDPDLLEARHDPIGDHAMHWEGGPAPRFDATYQIDLDIDAAPETVRFNKPPLEVELRSLGGRILRLIGVHAKSKAARGATDDAHEARLAIESRREQLAQCIWLRHRVVEHLKAGDSLIVLGDFNDGPGLDEYEQLFGRSGVEIVLGWDDPPELRLYDPHARMVLGRRLAALPATARFYLAEEGQFFSALLDYVMVSPDLRALGARWRIWHPFDDPGCYADPGLSAALLAASDHFPVTVDLPIT